MPSGSFMSFVPFMPFMFRLLESLPRHGIMKSAAALNRPLTPAAAA